MAPCIDKTITFRDHKTEAALCKMRGIQNESKKKMPVKMKTRKSGIMGRNREFNIMSGERKERKWEKRQKVDW